LFCLGIPFQIFSFESTTFTSAFLGLTSSGKVEKPNQVSVGNAGAMFAIVVVFAPQ
jgi:hypothetical protein